MVEPLYCEGEGMDKETFEKGYAERSETTVKALHSLGLYGIPCDCDYEFCEGWQMTTKERQDDLTLTKGMK